ncbi:hypothetical protein LIER_32694 [Lithospermum erythrorhizon]|uniref:Uncharacterized protein n=1 Tax=Lithospermum erythrorhizon TaxID=34254 RepID=A0AAV3RUJ9_LITER
MVQRIANKDVISKQRQERTASNPDKSAINKLRREKVTAKRVARRASNGSIHSRSSGCIVPVLPDDPALDSSVRI